MPSSPPFSKLLIANRGEIAVRVIRACRELGIPTVAVTSEADSGAMHARMADEAWPIGPAPAAGSYLRAGAILEAARQSGAAAIHPGYGFLSENASFARAVLDAGLVWIGPPPEAMAAMGDKARARAMMETCGVPVVPGWQGADDDASLAGEAAAIGYPVLLKAASGGGGKGMRVVNERRELPELAAAARREAAHAFGNERLILEKYLPSARHVEIQVLADHHGNITHLNERECSIQRRHQKIVEEAPSPLLDPVLRKRMGAAAVAAARAAGYTNAGTVEFIVAPESGKFYFLEMNTRLQVEHPVTELTTSLDLVQFQIRIAAGERLPDLLPEVPAPRGHAIECRLYAEDPASGFLPAAGPLLKLVAPSGPGVRFDTGFATGDEIGTHYDPMIAKIIVHAPERRAAIRRMQTALRETIVLGVRSNLEFLQAVLDHPIFRDGAATTRFVENHLAGWAPPDDLPLEVLVAAALVEDRRSKTKNRESGAPSPWSTLTGFRLGGPGK